MNQEARRMQSISCRMNVARINHEDMDTAAGYPLVYVHRGKDDIVHLSQKPFQGEGLLAKIDNATQAISASWSWSSFP
jgi:hypothetical protein